ncbi:hypothetical protein [Paraburkholderia unamae]|uniref:hypothetical protein n=1 Tax=Paraburkholderia unamae TaxID=219649 RepID=UPI0010582A15|nr:hypothetical protein [Paraburkholderia unamae]
MTIVTGPTIVNPDDLDTIDELRRALHIANESLLSQFARLTSADEAGQQIAIAMESVLRAHIQNDAIAVVERLNEYLADRPKLRAHLEEQLESEQSRQVH